MVSPQPEIVTIAAQLQMLGAQLHAMSVQETLATQLSETVANPTNFEERIAAIETDIKNAQSTFNSIQQALDGIKAVLAPLNQDLDRRTAEAHNEDVVKYNAGVNESQKLIRLRDRENKPILGLPTTIADLYRMPENELDAVLRDVKANYCPNPDTVARKKARLLDYVQGRCPVESTIWDH